MLLHRAAWDPCPRFGRPRLAFALLCACVSARRQELMWQVVGGEWARPSRRPALVFVIAGVCAVSLLQFATHSTSSQHIDAVGVPVPQSSAVISSAAGSPRVDESETDDAEAPVASIKLVSQEITDVSHDPVDLVMFTSWAPADEGSDKVRCVEGVNGDRALTTCCAHAVLRPIEYIACAFGTGWRVCHCVHCGRARGSASALPELPSCDCTCSTQTKLSARILDATSLFSVFCVSAVKRVQHKQVWDAHPRQHVRHRDAPLSSRDLLRVRRHHSKEHRFVGNLDSEALLLLFWVAVPQVHQRGHSVWPRPPGHASRRLCCSPSRFDRCRLTYCGTAVQCRRAGHSG